MFTYGFYNSLNGDRKYDAVQMASIFDGIIEDGVYSNVGEIFAVVPGTGLQVIVKTGRAWFKHTWNLNDSWMPIDLEQADPLRSRIDSVVIEVNSSLDVRENSIKIIKGDIALEPKAPEMIHDDGIDQYRLANITIGQNVTEILEENIDIAVGKDETPFVTAPLKSVDISDLFNQWNGEFQTWFSNIKAQLEGDVVTNLQKQIDERVKIEDMATSEDIENGTVGKWIDASVAKNELSGLLSGLKIGDVVFSYRDLEAETDGKLLACDQRIINVSDYPELCELKDMRYRYAVDFLNEGDMRSLTQLQTYIVDAYKLSTRSNTLSQDDKYLVIRATTSTSSSTTYNVISYLNMETGDTKSIHEPRSNNVSLNVDNTTVLISNRYFIGFNINAGGTSSNNAAASVACFGIPDTEYYGTNFTFTGTFQSAISTQLGAYLDDDGNVIVILSNGIRVYINIEEKNVIAYLPNYGLTNAYYTAAAITNNGVEIGKPFTSPIQMDSNGNEYIALWTTSTSKNGIVVNILRRDVGDNTFNTLYETTDAYYSTSSYLYFGIVNDSIYIVYQAHNLETHTRIYKLVKVSLSGVEEDSFSLGEDTEFDYYITAALNLNSRTIFGAEDGIYIAMSIYNKIRASTSNGLYKIYYSDGRIEPVDWKPGAGPLTPWNIPSVSTDEIFKLDKEYMLFTNGYISSGSSGIASSDLQNMPLYYSERNAFVSCRWALIVGSKSGEISIHAVPVDFVNTSNRGIIYVKSNIDDNLMYVISAFTSGASNNGSIYKLDLKTKRVLPYIKNAFIKALDKEVDSGDESIKMFTNEQ